MDADNNDNNKVVHSKIHRFVLLCGQKGSGKSTLAQSLVNVHHFVEFSYATALKDVVSTIYKWPRSRLDGLTAEDRVWRETKDEYWSDFYGAIVTPRSELQRIGTNLFRNHLHQDIWIASVLKSIFDLIALFKIENKPVRIVISDCRFENEISIVTAMYGHVAIFNTYMLERVHPNPNTEHRKKEIRKKLSAIPYVDGYSKFLTLMATEYPDEHISEWETTWLFNSAPRLFTGLIKNNFDNPTDLLSYFASVVLT